MDPNNTFDHIDQIFAEVSELAPADREAYLAEHCKGNEKTVETVRRLLAAQSQMGDFLQAPLLDFSGRMFGAYRAVEEIGRGGMSVVYRGERVDGSFDKEVAIKVLLVQMDGGIYAAETQILASLEHPSIARLLDAGVTPIGLRYLVMEFVDGVPCTDYAEADTEEKKLTLFLQVCAGVQAAHGALIIHRDLKPSNIFVTHGGRVKLLDFGIAKLLTHDATQTVGTRAYTADYASPEQILGRASGTSNDIYSLGVLLCEWLGGKVPRKLSHLALGEIVEQVRDRDVVDLPLRGDLKQIAGKALRNRPEERYLSVAELTRDVERYLANEAVEARFPTWSYLAGKFVSRHRYATFFAALFVVSLATVAAIAWRQATLAEQRFDQVRALAHNVMFELHDEVQPLNGSLPARRMIVLRSLEYLDALAKDAQGRQDLLRDLTRGYLRLAEIQGKDYEAASVGESESAQQQISKALATAQALVKHDGSLQNRRLLYAAWMAQSSALALQAKYEDAAVPALSARRLAADLLNQYPKDAEVKAELARAEVDYGDAISDRTDKQESLQNLQSAVRHYDELVSDGVATEEMLDQRTRALNYLTSFYFRNQQIQEARKACDAGLGSAKRLYERNARKYLANYASAVGQSAAISNEMKDYPAAIANYQEQLRLREELLSWNTADKVTALRVAATMIRLGFAYQQAGRIGEAVWWGERALQQTLALHRQDTDSQIIVNELFYARLDLAQSYMLDKRTSQGCSQLAEVQALVRTRPGLARTAAGQTKRLENLSQRCSLKPEG